LKNSPVISLWIERIKKFTNKKFLPKQERELILSLLKFIDDSYKDRGETKSCTKIYPEASGITGGLGHITCQHGITKGYTAMKNGEPLALFAQTIFKRLPKRVKAERRVFVYDNCCISINLH
jgi:hypothetical protein